MKSLIAAILFVLSLSSPSLAQTIGYTHSFSPIDGSSWPPDHIERVYGTVSHNYATFSGSGPSDYWKVQMIFSLYKKVNGVDQAMTNYHTEFSIFPGTALPQVRVLPPGGGHLTNEGEYHMKIEVWNDYKDDGIGVFYHTHHAYFTISEQGSDGGQSGS